MAKSWSKVGFKSAIGVLDGDDRLVDLQHLSNEASSLSLQEDALKAAKELGKMLSAAADKIWPNLGLYYSMSIPDRGQGLVLLQHVCKLDHTRHVVAVVCQVVVSNAANR